MKTAHHTNSAAVNRELSHATNRKPAKASKTDNLPVYLAAAVLLLAPIAVAIMYHCKLVPATL